MYSVLSAPHEIDEYELIDPVDLLTLLEKSGFWDGVVSTVLLSDIILTNCTTFFSFLLILVIPWNFKLLTISSLYKNYLVESCQVVREKGGYC